MSSNAVSNNQEKIMKLTVFGATGSIGRHLISQALESGHQVTAFSRQPQSLTIKHPNLTLFTGDVTNLSSVTKAIEGADCVLITLGSAGLTSKVRSVGTANIVQAMQQLQVKRLICQTTLGVGDSSANLNFFWKYIMFGLILRFVFKDHVLQETIVKRSNLDWIIVRPAAFIDEELNETYRSGFPVSEKNLTLSISRKHVADFMLRQLSDNTFLKQTPGLSY